MPLGSSRRVKELHGPGSAQGSMEWELFLGSYWLEKKMVQDWGVGNMAKKAWLVWGQMGKIRLSVDEMVTSQMQRGQGLKALTNPNESLQSPAGRMNRIGDVLSVARSGAVRACLLSMRLFMPIRNISQFLIPSFLICSETAWPGASC